MRSSSTFAKEEVHSKRHNNVCLDLDLSSGNLRQVLESPHALSKFYSQNAKHVMNVDQNSDSEEDGSVEEGSIISSSIDGEVTDFIVNDDEEYDLLSLGRSAGAVKRERLADQKVLQELHTKSSKDKVSDVLHFIDEASSLLGIGKDRGMGSYEYIGNRSKVDPDNKDGEVMVESDLFFSPEQMLAESAARKRQEAEEKKREKRQMFFMQMEENSGNVATILEALSGNHRKKINKRRSWLRDTMEDEDFEFGGGGVDEDGNQNIDFLEEHEIEKRETVRERVKTLQDRLRVEERAAQLNKLNKLFNIRTKRSMHETDQLKAMEEKSDRNMANFEDIYHVMENDTKENETKQRRFLTDFKNKLEQEKTKALEVEREMQSKYRKKKAEKDRARATWEAQIKEQIRSTEKEIESVMTKLKKHNDLTDKKTDKTRRGSTMQNTKQRERGGRIQHLLDTIDKQQTQTKELTAALHASVKELNDLMLQEKEKEKIRTRDAKVNLLQKKRKEMEKKRRAHEKSKKQKEKNNAKKESRKDAPGGATTSSGKHNDGLSLAQDEEEEEDPEERALREKNKELVERYQTLVSQVDAVESKIADTLAPQEREKVLKGKYQEAEKRNETLLRKIEVFEKEIEAMEQQRGDPKLLLRIDNLESTMMSMRAEKRQIENAIQKRQDLLKKKRKQVEQLQTKGVKGSIAETSAARRRMVLDRGLNPAKVFSIAIQATLECNDLVNLTSNHDSLQSKKALVTHQDVNNKMPLSALKPSTNRQLNHKNVTISHGKNQPRYLTSCSSCPSGKMCGDIVEAENTNACSGSHTKITSSTECQNAANRLGYTWKGDETYSGYPSGCYRYKSSRVYYNKHSTGSAQSNSFPICQGCILECPAGQYLPTTSSSQCNECPKGRYGSTVGLRICTECPAGRYGSTTGLQSSSCTGACDSGSLFNSTGSVSAECSPCSSCPSGKMCGDIVEAENTNACSGSHTKITSSTECQNAANRLGYTWKGDETYSGYPSGCFRRYPFDVYYNKHSTGIADSDSFPICQGCILECPAGQYLPNTNSSQCNDCPKGRYGSTVGLRICTECPAGRYGSTTGLQSSSCTGACDPASPEDPGSVNAQCSSSLCPQVPSECQMSLTISTETALKNAVTSANGGRTSSYVQGTYRYDDFFMDVHTNKFL
eukprot:g97.t1